MEKNQNDHRSQQSDSKSNQPSAGEKSEDTQKKPRIPLPNKPEKNIPVKSDLDNRRTIKNRPHPH